MSTVKCMFSDLCRQRSSLYVVRRSFALAVDYKPKLKPRAVQVREDEERQLELQRRKAKQLPALESIKIPQRVERGPTDILKVNKR